MSESPREEESSEKQYPVRRVCSWCKKEMGIADFTRSEPGGITHAICDDCQKGYLNEAEKAEKK